MLGSLEVNSVDDIENGDALLFFVDDHKATFTKLLLWRQCQPQQGRLSVTMKTWGIASTLCQMPVLLLTTFPLRVICAVSQDLREVVAGRNYT